MKGCAADNHIFKAERDAVFGANSVAIVVNPAGLVEQFLRLFRVVWPGLYIRIGLFAVYVKIAGRNLSFWISQDMVLDCDPVNQMGHCKADFSVGKKRPCLVPAYP